MVVVGLEPSYHYDCPSGFQTRPHPRLNTFTTYLKTWTKNTTTWEEPCGSPRWDLDEDTVLTHRLWRRVDPAQVHDSDRAR